MSGLADNIIVQKVSNKIKELLQSHNQSSSAHNTLFSNKADKNHTHDSYANPTIVDNVTTNDATKVLSAKQGKVLQDNLTSHNTDNTAHNNIQIKPIEYIVGTQTTSTNAWTGTSTKISTLEAGICILYRLPYASTNSNVSLNLTLTGGGKTGAKAVYFTSTTRVKQQYGVNAIICLVYDGSYWRVVSPYTDTNYYDRNRFSSTGVKIKTAFTNDYGLLCGDKNGYECLGSGSSFSLDYPVLYFASTADMNVGDYNTNVYTNYSTVAVSYIKSDMTLTPGEMVYLVGTMSNNTFTVDSSIVTQTPNNTSKVYLPIGMGITATNFIFFPIYQLLTYDGSNLNLYVRPHTHTKSQISDFPSLATVATSGSYNDLSNKPTSITPASHTHGNLQNDGKVGTSNNISKNVVTDSSGKITTEDKPTLSNLGGAVTVTKQGTAESGYSATYVISQGGTALSPKINIPKDFLVKSGEIKSATTANSPIQGLSVGDKYLDFTVNTTDNSETGSHIYINVKDLVDAYTAGTGLTLTNNAFNVNIADNLTTDDATQVLSAKQGKVLKDLIGDAITYINQ